MNITEKLASIGYAVEQVCDGLDHAEMVELVFAMASMSDQAMSVR